MKLFFKNKLLIFTIISLLVFSTACSSSGDKNTSDSDSKEPIKIGMTSALTGPYSEFGVGNKHGVELAIEKWNKNGGINGRKIELVALDDQLVPDKAAVNMQQLVEDDEIVAIIGPAGSGPALATVPITEAAGKVHMNVIPQTIEVTYPNGVDKPPRKNVFSFALQNDVEANVLGEFVGKQWKKIALMHESTAYGKSGVELISKILENKYDTKPLAIEEFNQGTTDMTSQLAKIKNTGAEVLVVIGLGADLANVKKGMNRLNMNIPLVASNGALSPPYQEGAGELVVGTFGSMIGALGEDPLSPEAEEFAKAYKEKFGVDRYWGDDEERPHLFMSLNVVNAYDAANVLFEAMKNAKSLKSEDIIEALENIKDYKGVNATYTFNKQKHHAIDEFALGIFEYVKEGDKIVLKKFEE